MIARSLRALRRVRHRGGVGDDTVTMCCRHCHGEPLQDCSCQKDCRFPSCPWPLWHQLHADRELAAWLSALATTDEMPADEAP